MSCIGGTLGALESSRVSAAPILCRVFLAYLGLGKKRAMRDGANLRVFFLCCFSHGLQRSHLSELWVGRRGEWTEGVSNFLILVPCNAGNSATRHAVSTKR